jgi:hypothetical protein
MITGTRVALIFVLTLVLACLVGCEPGYIRHTEKFAAQVKSVVNPDELQAWATNLIAETPALELHERRYLEQAEIPDYIRAIDKDQIPDVEIVNWGDAVIVQIWFGGGFGHWGLYVASPEWTRKSSETHYIVEWKPGIYFWNGP